MARVLLVGKGPPETGGIPAFLRMLLESDLVRRHDVAFCNLTRPGEHEGGRATARNLWRTVRDSVIVFRAAGGRDLVHLHSAVFPAPTLLRAGSLAGAARLRGARVLVHAHGGGLHLWLVTTRRRWLARLALAPAWKIAAVAESGRTVLEPAVGARRLLVVENGVDPDRFPPAEGSGGPPRVLFAGLLTPRKGLLDLFSVSERLRAEGVGHELWVAGGVPDEGEEGQGQVLAAVPDGTRMLGARPHAEMPALFRQADVFCLPSWWEAMPLAVLEAMAAGLPVVACRVGDVARICVDGETALLVEPRQRDQLHAALKRLLTDADLRRRLGGAGRRRIVERYNLARTVAAIDELWSESGAR